MAESGSILGNAVTRKEDPGLLTGANKYIDDLDIDGVAHIAFARSTIAHGTIDSIDISEASAMPGVLAACTANELELPAVSGLEGVLDQFSRPPLATGKVRFVGDILAAVVAETQAQAEDAVNAVFADITPLPAVTDPGEALADGAPIIWDDAGSNQCMVTSLGGDEDPLEGADTVVEETILSQRLAGVPMEPNGCVIVPKRARGRG